MPTIEFDRKLVEKLVKKKLSDTELKEKITMFGTPVEELTKNEIKVEVFPNRPDLLSEQGFSRGFGAYLGTKKAAKYAVKKASYKVIVDASVKNVRPYTACAVVKKLKFNDSTIKQIIKIQEKLHGTYGRNRKRCAIGVYPLDKIAFPVRYTAKKPNEIRFMPLESSKNMTATQILNEHPAGKEYKHLLEKESVYPIFIDSKDRVLSMPPIINSHSVGKVDESTKDVFVECTGFNQGVLNKCINIIVSALADMGGSVESVNITNNGKTITTPDLSAQTMNIDVSYVNKKLGLSLKEKDLKPLFAKMNLEYNNKKVLVPSYRADILHPIDLVEDLAIAYGYDNFKEEIPQVATIGKEDAFEKFKNKVAHILVGMGIQEVNSTHIVDVKHQTKDMLLDFKPVMLYNSLTADYNSLRGIILPSLMNALKLNKINEYPQQIFEIGTIFKWDKANKTETGVVENTRVAVAVCHPKANYTEIRQKVERVLKLLGVSYAVKEKEHASYIPRRVARVSVNNVDVAYVGELHPQVLENFELEMPVAAFELNLTELFAEFKKQNKL
ncbi:MAG TPA: phenylalanine--tRNA ligase subunit beta [Candidatus Nanoarchaeia archaeon]|nr:phenylalanine--tRNA ligase subunit beta [Candidatus Nanoarchaeia archaeon]